MAEKGALFGKNAISLIFVNQTETLCYAPTRFCGFLSII